MKRTGVPSDQAILRHLFERSMANLGEQELETVKKLLAEYSDVFPKGSMDVGHTDTAKQHIRREDATPNQHCPRRLHMSLQEEAGRAAEEMEQHGIIEPLVFPCGADEESGRFCVDYILFCYTQRLLPGGVGQGELLPFLLVAVQLALWPL